VPTRDDCPTRSPSGSNRVASGPRRVVRPLALVSSAHRGALAAATNVHRTVAAWTGGGFGLSVAQAPRNRCSLLKDGVSVVILKKAGRERT
jgi:hypothetical protein